MKLKNVIILVICVAVVFGAGGYIVGKNSQSIVSSSKISEENKVAYQKGWSYWFTGYGMNGEGMAYINYYKDGRNYNNTFADTREAFYTGYQDGFYYVNHEDMKSDHYSKEMEKGYIEYYPN